MRLTDEQGVYLQAARFFLAPRVVGQVALDASTFIQRDLVNLVCREGYFEPLVSD